MKMNKKGFEISINMIVIVIISVVTLFLALGLIQGWFKTIPPLPFPDVEDATADRPINFNPSDIQRGKATKMSISFYNNEQEDIPNTVTPKISCVDISEVTVKASGLNVPIGEVKKYEAIVTIPKNTPADMYSCTITISNTEETFTITVK